MSLFLVKWFAFVICNCALVNSIYYTGLNGLSEEDRIVAKLANIIKEREGRWASSSSPSEKDQEKERGRKMGLLFSYHFPNDNNNNNESPFAVPPTDPRYHQNLAIDEMGRESVQTDVRGAQRNYVTGLVDNNQRHGTIDENPENSAKTHHHSGSSHNFHDNGYSGPDQYSSKEFVLHESNSNTKPSLSKPSEIDDSDRESYVDTDFIPSEPSAPARHIQFERVIKTPLFSMAPDNWSSNDMYYTVMVAGCSAAAVLGLSILGFGWYRLQRRVKAASDVDYPAYGVTGPHKDSSPTGDRRLAHSAQMYHYQHQKQQIIAMENGRTCGEARRGSVSEADSDEEGDYTVYECPGLAVAGEMEVKNPLFNDEPLPDAPLPKSEESTINTNETLKTQID